MVYVLMSDGELQIGTTWESLMLARQHSLNNLTILVDRNGFQAMGKTREILDYSWLLDAPGIDGHDFEKIALALDEKHPEGTKVLFFNTVKGRGVSFMEDNNLFHYKAPSEAEYKEALAELNG